jgi:AcrR family transcriptional regulator
MLMKRKANRPQQARGRSNPKSLAAPQPRIQRVGPGDRKRELVEIAYRLIAEKGLEGFRIRQVAAEADIDNGTLHYHFPSKEALIHGVVDYLVEDLQRNRAGQQQVDQNALEELRREFEDIRLRVRDTPEQLTVLSELAIRSWRDPEIARIFKKVDDGWRSHLLALLDRGVQQGIFRQDLNQPLCARAIMVALRGISYQSRLPGRQLDLLLSQLAAQTELWLTGNRPSSATRVNRVNTTL